MKKIDINKLEKLSLNTGKLCIKYAIPLTTMSLGLSDILARYQNKMDPQVSEWIKFNCILGIDGGMALFLFGGLCVSGADLVKNIKNKSLQNKIHQAVMFPFSIQSRMGNAIGKIMDNLDKKNNSR